MSQNHQAVHPATSVDWVSHAVATLSAIAVTGSLLMSMSGIAGHQYRDALAEQASQTRLAQTAAARTASCDVAATSSRQGA